MKSLWCDEVSEFHGELYDLPPCRMYPKPVQTPHPPIHVGGESDAALRRVARHGQGWFTFNRLPEDLRRAARAARRALAAEGRTRRRHQRCRCARTSTQRRRRRSSGYAAAGVDRLIVLCLAFGPDDLATTLDELVADVLEPALAL